MTGDYPKNLLEKRKCYLRSVPANIARGLNTDQACEVGAVTEGNIPGTY